jgi:hypothetical protein
MLEEAILVTSPEELAGICQESAFYFKAVLVAGRDDSKL